MFSNEVVMTTNVCKYCNHVIVEMTQINNLCDDLLSYLFDFLSDKYLYRIEMVCKRWQILVRNLLSKKVSLNRVDYYGSKFITYEPHGNWQFIIDDNNIDILKNILLKCSNIEQVNLHRTLVTGKNNLLYLADLCPQLKRINFYHSIIDVDENEWKEFAKKLGPQLIQCNFDCFNFNFMSLLFKEFKNIQEIRFDTKNNEECKELFCHLNSCLNLKAIRWGIYDIHVINPQDLSLINVLQRINRLETRLNTMFQLKGQFDNLTQLILWRSWHFINEIDGNQLTFPNLIKLTLRRFGNEHLKFLSNFKFPKLESLVISTLGNVTQLPSSFVVQIQHIKSFAYQFCKFDLNLISSLDNLVNFEFSYLCFNTKSYSKLCKYLDILLHHPFLNNIKITIDDCYLDDNIFKEIDNLIEEKPNVIIEILIRKGILNTERLNQYKINFDAMKNIKKFNIKITFY